jgi:hypothetical protein
MAVVVVAALSGVILTGLTDWPTDRLTDRQTGTQTGRLTDNQSD